jgi:MFS family permease
VPVMLGPILGPVIAGAILQHASWRWPFLVNLPVGALAIVLAIFFADGNLLPAPIAAFMMLGSAETAYQGASTDPRPRGR